MEVASQVLPRKIPGARLQNTETASPLSVKKKTILSSLQMKKADRNKQYVAALLQLESPVITDKMLTFLLKEEVCRALVEFIAFPSHDDDEAEVFPGGNDGSNQVGEEKDEIRREGGHDQTPPKRQRPCTSGEVTTALKQSYAATMILAGSHPTGASTELVVRMSTVIFDALFSAFHPYSTASFVHVVHVLDYLAEEDMDAILDQIMGVDASAVTSPSTNSPQKNIPSMESMDRYLLPLLLHCEHSPVVKFLVRILTCEGASKRPVHGASL